MPIFTAENYELTRLRKMAGWASGRTVLDIGHADWPNPYLDLELCTGYDRAPTRGALRYAEEVQGDVSQLAERLAGRRFEAILAGELIEHLEDPYGFLKTAQSLLSPAGRLVLSTPNPLAIPTLACEWARSRRFFYASDHAFYFAPRWMVRMLERSGFEVLSVQPVGLWPFGWIPAPVALSYQVIYIAAPVDPAT